MKSKNLNYYRLSELNTSIWKNLKMIEESKLSHGMRDSLDSLIIETVRALSEEVGLEVNEPQ